MNVKKIRIDLLLVQKGLAASRQKAQAIILAGNVIAGDTRIDKAGQLVLEDVEIRLRGKQSEFVSRSAEKLKGALEKFECTVRGVALDVGASTGGFTQVLLQKGAEKVYAVDVGTNQLHWELRKDPRVVSIEKTNARNMTFDAIGQKVNWIVIDVSFIGLDKIVPNLLQFADPDTQWLILIKPQFEAGADKVGKGGIIKDPSVRKETVQRVVESLESFGLNPMGLIESSLKGAKGNQEYLALWRGNGNKSE